MISRTISPLIKIGLQFFGVWPDMPYGTVRRFFHVIFILIVQILQYLYVYSNFNLSQMQKLVNSFPTTFFYSVTVLKVVAMWKYHDLIRKLLATVDDDWRECYNIEQHLRSMMTKTSASKFYIYALVIFNTISGLLYCGGENLIAYMGLAVGYNVTTRPFPLQLFYPFDAEQSPIYDLIVLFLLLHSVIVVYTANVVSGLIISLVFHASGQIDIIRQELKTFSDEMVYLGHSGRNIKILVERHNKVITFSENLDTLFSFITMMQVFGNTLVSCFLGLVIITSQNNTHMDVIKSTSAYISITGEMFMFCIVGEYLGYKMIVRSTISPMLKIGLQFFGVWPDVPYGSVRRFIHIFSILFVQFFQYLYIQSHFSISELQSLMDSLPGTFYYSLTGIKVITLWKCQGVLRELLTIADADWCDTLNVKHYSHLMITKANLSKSFTYSLLMFCTVAGMLYFGSDNLMVFMHLLIGRNDTSRPFPVKMLLPFDAEQSPIYELLVIVLLIHSMSTVYTVNFLSGLVLTLVLHLSGQIEIIHQELRNFSESIFHCGSSGFTLKLLVQKHNKVISFSENLDKLFSFIALMQVFGNTLVICFLGLVFLTSQGEDNAGVLKIIFAYVGITVEIFMFCFVGEYLGLKNKSLGDAAYESLWYNMSPSHGKNILFVIMRCQKQMTITMGGITDLSLEAFTSIMKASASYMSVLNAMY